MAPDEDVSPIAKGRPRPSCLFIADADVQNYIQICKIDDSGLFIIAPSIRKKMCFVFKENDCSRLTLVRDKSVRFKG